MNCVERLTTNCLPVSPTTENMCGMSFFLPSRLHHRTITYSRASITSNFLIKLVIPQTAILCSACYFSKPTDVPSSRVIFILFISDPHILINIVLSAFWQSTEFNKIHDDDDDSRQANYCYFNTHIGIYSFSNKLLSYLLTINVKKT